MGTGVVLCGLFDYMDFKLIFPASISVAVLLFATFALSSVPVGHGLRLPKAIFNFPRSWLSREFLLLVLSWLLYMTVALAYYYRDKYKIEPGTILHLFGLAGLLGLVSVLSMQRTYHLRSVPSWTVDRALSMFVSTAFLIGIMGAAAFLHIFDGRSITDVLWHLHIILYLPLLCDALQVHELVRIKRIIIAATFTALRAPVYMIVFGLLGRIEIRTFAVSVLIALCGDITLRVAFFREETTSFASFLSNARRKRLSHTGIGGPQQ